MLFANKQFTTVDIGSHSIKAVRMMKNRDGISIMDTGVIDIPPDTLEDGKIVDVSIVGSELTALFEKMNYRPKNVITTVANNNLLIRNLEVPLMSEDELAETIKWEADDQLPFSVEQARFDYIILDKDEEKIKILLVAVKKEIVENFIAPLKKQGINPRVLNVQPMALLSLLEFQGELTEPVAILNIGDSATQVTIGTENNIHLSRTIDTGGKDFTETLIEGMGYSYQQAEEHKKKNGIEEKKEEKNEEFDLDSVQIAATGMSGEDALNSLAGSLAEEISRSLDFFSMKNRGRKVNKIYITGGGSKLKGLKKIISEEINREIRDIETFKGLEIESLEEADAEIFSVTIGLGISEVLANES